MTYLKAIEAGCDGIDTAISSFSGGTSQPATESMNYGLKQLGYDTGINENILKNINDFFKPIKDGFIKSGVLDPICAWNRNRCTCVPNSRWNAFKSYFTTKTTKFAR